MIDCKVNTVYVVEQYDHDEKSIYAICKNDESLDKLVDFILEHENVHKSEFEDGMFYYNSPMWMPMNRAYKISKVKVLE